MSNTQKPKSGYNLIVTGLTLLVLGVLFSLSGEQGTSSQQGGAVLVAVAGAVIALLGVGRRRQA